MSHLKTVLFIVAIILCLFIFQAITHAAELPTEISTTMQCDTYKIIVSDLMIDYEEKLVWEGQREGVYAGLFTNEITGSWTFIVYDDERSIACISSSGIGYNTP